jgi:hypothetical protein
MRRHQQDSDLADALLRILKSQPLTKVVEQAAVCCSAWHKADITAVPIHVRFPG